MAEPRTLYRKIWDDHVIDVLGDGRALLAVDRHLLHDGVAIYAFEALQAKGLGVRRPDLTLAVADHVLPTTSRAGVIPYEDDDARNMVERVECGRPGAQKGPASRAGPPKNRCTTSSSSSTSPR